ncbi:MAG: C39 family peptidase [Sphingomonadaceae bacterium]|nr:C39 family peptidase [Sphingomonadaceae bacterium]
MVRSWIRSGVMGAAALLLTSPGAPAQAEVQLSRESGGDFSVSVMSWWEIPFRTVVRQRYDFSCGSAAVATILTHHYGRPTGEQEPFKAMWAKGDKELIRKVGFSMFDMKTYLTDLGYTTEGFRLKVDDLAKIKRPMIVLLDLNGFKHFVVVKGFKDGRVLTGDSVLGLTQYSAEDFGKMWNGIALAIVKTPQPIRPRYNLASDWGPWSQAPLEEGNDALAVSISDLTTHLPPDYQLTPTILLDVRVGTVQ